MEGSILEADSNKACQDGSTLLDTAVFMGHTEAVKVLLEHGANINKARQDGLTLLNIAVINGDTKTVKLLLEYKAEVNKNSQGGMTPLCFAAYQGYTEIVKLLLKHGAEVDKTWEGSTPFDIAIEYGHLDSAKLILGYYQHIDNATILLILRKFHNPQSNLNFKLLVLELLSKSDNLQDLNINSLSINNLFLFQETISIIQQPGSLYKILSDKNFNLDNLSKTELEKFLPQQGQDLDFNNSDEKLREFLNIAKECEAKKKYQQAEYIFCVKFKEEAPKPAFEAVEAKYPSKDGGPELAEDFNSSVFNAINLKESKDARLAIKALQKLFRNNKLDEGNFTINQISELLTSELARQKVIYKEICAQEKKSTTISLFELEELLAIKKLIIAANKDEFSWGKEEEKQLFFNLFCVKELMNRNDDDTPKDIPEKVKEGITKELKDLKPIAKTIALVLNMIDCDKLQEVIDLAYARVNIDRVSQVVGSKIANPKALQLLALTAKGEVISKIGSAEI
jgi:ankyrin repeat protein